MKLEEVILRDTRANQPLATDVPAGTIFYVSDEGVTERSNGTSWEDISDAAGVATAMTAGDYGDIVVTDDDSTPQTWTIDTDAVTTAKILDANVTDAKISNRAAVSVFGRSANSGGVGADIAAGANDRLLARTADSVAFQQLSVGMVPADTITGAKLTSSQRTRTIGITVDGGGSEITTGVKGYIRCPVGGTLDSWTILADQSGAIKFDVWKDTFANFPPTNADSITNAHEPEITASGTNAEDTDITDWTTTTVTAGDVIGFNVDSCTSITRATLQLVLLVTA